MDKKPHVLRLYYAGWCRGLSRLADIGPSEMTVFTEAADWNNMAADFREAIDGLTADDPRVAHSTARDEELVDA